MSAGARRSSSTVLTSKRCVRQIAVDFAAGDNVAFAVGPNLARTVDAYPIVDYDEESTVPVASNALSGDLGSDVGVVYLERPVQGVKPLAVGSLSAADIGSAFVIVGYGAQGNPGLIFERQVGSVTLRGLSGKYFEYAYGSFEALLLQAKTNPDFRGLDEATLRRQYEDSVLIPGYQAAFGGLPGESQPCFGDEGAPVSIKRNGVRTIVGLFSLALGSDQLFCDHGGLFAALGPAALAFAQEASGWTDPCASVTVAGHCEGDSAVRCTTRLEGRRRASRTDCALLGMRCGLDAVGSAVCMDGT